MEWYINETWTFLNELAQIVVQPWSFLPTLNLIIYCANCSIHSNAGSKGNLTLWRHLKEVPSKFGTPAPLPWAQREKIFITHGLRLPPEYTPLDLALYYRTTYILAIAPPPPSYNYYMYIAHLRCTLPACESASYKPSVTQPWRALPGKMANQQWRATWQHWLGGARRRPSASISYTLWQRKPPGTYVLDTSNVTCVTTSSAVMHKRVRVGTTCQHRCTRAHPHPHMYTHGQS